MSNIYGYIRVSSKDQNEDRQVIAMNERNIPSKNIYMDKQSGKDFNRPAYQKLLKKLKKGDCLIVKSIDRLGRNYKEIMEQWRIITKEMDVDIIVIDMPLLDTTKSKDLLGTFISDIVLQLLSFVAENERNNIRQRQAEGIAAAKQKGVIFGRPNKKIPKDFPEIYNKWKSKEISPAQAYQLAGLKQSNFYKVARKYEKLLLKQ
ncbi:MAG: recombinase family protein [Oscillospiraceae bacterium]